MSVFDIPLQSPDFIWPDHFKHAKNRMKIKIINNFPSYNFVLFPVILGFIKDDVSQHNQPGTTKKV